MSLAHSEYPVIQTEFITRIPIGIVIGCNGPGVCNKGGAYSEPEFNYN